MTADAQGSGGGPRPMLLEAGPVGAVLFDYGLTLAHFQRPVEPLEAAADAIASLLERSGWARPDGALLREAVHGRVEKALAAHEASGALEEVDVAALERSAFADIGLHLDADLLDRCTVIMQEAWWRGVRTYPDVVSSLGALRDGGLRIGLCSNAAYRSASMHAQLEHVGLDRLLDAAVFSGEVGWRKPSPRLFEAALHALGARAAETVFVGDRLREDVGGAAASGMRTVLIVRDGDSPSPPIGQPQPNAVIRALSELPGILFGARL